MSVLDDLESRASGIHDDALRETYLASVAALRRVGVATEADLSEILMNPLRPSDVRTLAVWALGEMRSETAAGELFRVMADPELALEAAKAILKLGVDHATLSSRFESFLRSRDASPISRAAAAYALGYVATGETVRTLQTILADREETPVVRSHCAEAMGTLRAHDAIDTLLDALRDDDAAVRFWCVYALGELRDPRAVAPLRDIADHDHAHVPGMGSLSDEARQVLESFHRT